LIDLNSDVTFSHDERQRKKPPVTPPLLAGFSMQLLRARIAGAKNGALVEIARQWEIERRLDNFGISLAAVAQVAGLEFYQLAMEIRRELAP